MVAEDDDGSDDVIRIFDAFGDRVRIDNGSGNAPVNRITFRVGGSRGAGSGRISLALEPADDCLCDMRREITITAGGATRSERMECR